MSKIICTGLSGFIGTHLRKRLERDNHVIHVLHDYLYQPDVLKKAIETTEPDYIFHLAGYGNHYFHDDEIMVYRANLEALDNLLNVTKDLKYKGFLNFSTTFHNLESSSFYGSTKAGGEYLVRAYVNKYDLPIVNIRPYSIFGEYEWAFRFIPTISEKIRNSETITVSDVSHDWTYVEDFITELLKVQENIDTLKGKSVGIGSGVRRSNLDIAKAVMRVADKDVNIEEGVKRTYEIAAYGKEMENKTKTENNEIFYQANQTSLEEALGRVYNSPGLWLKKQTY